jgi:hexosaminidase
MKRIIALAGLLCMVGEVFAQTALPAVLPQPVEIKGTEGVFLLNPSSSITVDDNNPDALRTAEYLAGTIRRASGYPMVVRSGGIMPLNIGNILLSLNKTADPQLGGEGYRLEATNAMLTIRANKPAGLFYGVQTLLQLLPPDLEGKQSPNQKERNWEIPCVQILDYPRFGWRGLMLDVSRHFFTKEEVKAFIDEMVRYKFNLLHWHLTDDEGWRVEIRSYPNLTKKGAWSATRVGTFGNFTPPAADEPRDYGGYYTQEDIREIVRYAAERHVDILPEVDVPGHSLATIASYPELSCTPGADKYVVRSGEKIMNWYSGGFTALVDNTLCPANEKVYVFLDKVIGEIASLFPFEYIHMGGDECAKNFWEKNPQVLELMKKEKLKDMHEVQSYFVKRVSGIITSKNRKLIGWDEILEGGLPANAAVMSWRGMKGGIEAAKMGHEVVMTPTTFAYLDYMQSDAKLEAPVYASLRLKKSYEFEPVPEGVDPRLIKGGQGNIWTEQIYQTRQLQYMTWPRGIALAEALWSPQTSRNWNRFAAAVESNFARMDARQVKYSPAMFDPIIAAKKDASGKLKVELSNELEGLQVHYSFDNSQPDCFYPASTGPLSVPREASMLKVVSCRNGKIVGRQIDLTIAELEKRAGITK